MAVIIGTPNNDVLNSLTADDTLKGLAGDDTYNIDSSKDIVVETANAGTDTIKFAQNYNIGTTKSYTLADNVENLNLKDLDLSSTLSAPQLSALETNQYIINGNALNNTITASDSSADYIKILAGAGNDTVIGGIGDDNIDGGSGTDTLIGNDGNDTLFGGADASVDTLQGGAGNDTYTLVDTKDIITDASGDNIIKLDKSFSPSVLGLGSDAYGYNYSNSNISTIDASAITKSLILKGNGNSSTTIISGAGSDTIYGGFVDDVIHAGAGNDTIYGGGGANKMYGEDGNDTFLIDGHTNLTSPNSEIDGGTGIDTIKLMDSSGAYAGNTTLSLGDFKSVENLDASSITATNLTLTGTSADNTITGGAGNDIIDGGLGTDSLIGGKGNDTYLVSDTRNKITEAANAGNDSVVFKSEVDFGTSKIFTLADNIETLDLTELTLTQNQKTAFTTTKLTINGNAGNNTIYANDTDGAFIKILGGAGNDTLIGGLSNDYLDGGVGDDTLYGGAGTNSLVGGAGNDTYQFDGVGTNAINDSAGTDTIQLLGDSGGNYATTEFSIAPISYNMIENIDASALTAAMNLSGNDLNNTIKGGAGNDTIFGGKGSDTLMGGAGDDTYLVNGRETATSITDTSGNDTMKLVATSGAFAGKSTVSLAAYATVENLNASAITTGNLTLSGNALNNIITGGAGNDTISGGAGANVLLGEAGNDTYLIDGTESSTTITDTAGNDTLKLVAKSGAFAGSQNISLADYTGVENLDASGITKGNLTLSGNALNNTITGATGNDIIFGGAGSNSLIGGAGNDTYLVDGTETATAITDTAGTDTLKLVATAGAFAGNKTVSLTGYTTIENLDASAITASNLTLSGNDLDNTITGGSGNDTIYGGKGKNTLIGGSGNDTYQIDGVGTNIITDSAGSDTIALKADINGKYAGSASASVSLASYTNIENLDGSAITATNLTLTGNASNNTLTGGAGNNTLVGGAGDDTYLFYGKEKTTTINDSAGYDIVRLVGDSNGVFGSNTFSIAGFTGIDEIDASTITSDLTFMGNNSGNTIHGGLGANTLFGGSGNDTYLIDSLATVTINDSGGTDTVRLLAGQDGKFAGLNIANISMTTYTGVENIDASAITATDLTITGNSLDNALSGGAGNDNISGGLGSNTLLGGAGNDTYLIDGTETATTITDSSGNDTLKLVATGGEFAGSTTVSLADYTGVENLDASAITETNLTLSGNNLNNTIIGGAGDDNISSGNGNDTIFGGLGSNSLVGGDGNDTYLIDGNEDATSITDSAGTDTLKLVATEGGFAGNSTIVLAGYTDVENLDASAITAEGLALSGNDLDNKITGGSGSDVIFGGLGSNSLVGGAGNDTYLINGKETSTTITDSSGNDTIELVAIESAFAGSSTVSLAGYADVENLDASGIINTDLTLSGNDLANVITGGAGADFIFGGKGDDSLYGGDGSDNLSGGDGDDYINGGNGDDTIWGGKGSNILEGGDGNDTYLINGDESYTSIIETADGGNDTIKFNAPSAFFNGITTYTMDLKDYANVENIDAFSMFSTDMTLIGNDLDNVLTSSDGNDTLFGGLGSNSLLGGAGNDTYLIDGNETATTITDIDGTDTLKLVATAGGFAGNSTVSLAGYADVENLDASAITTGDLTLSGNDLDNTITGGDCNDTIFGGLGSNSLAGGAGNDTYLINGNETSTTITDSSGNDTLKLVATAGGFAGNSTVSLAGYADVENLDASAITTGDLTLSGNDLDNTITGGAGNDTVSGGLGSNSLMGGAGNDTYLIDGNETATSITDTDGTDTLKLVATEGLFAGNSTLSLEDYTGVEILDASAITGSDLTLSGNGSDNTIFGGAGNDTIFGGLGSNSLVGGAGNDTYLIDGKETATSITDTGGIDTLKLVATAGEFAGNSTILLAGYTDVENLDASAITTGDLALSGNDLDNKIIGGAGNDFIFGGLGSNSLAGGAGNDTYLINGKETSTTITDSSGNDTIELVAIESAFAGNSTISLAGYADVENLDASAITTGDLTLSGNDLDNTITGGAGNDTVSGGLGSNSLMGGAGNDTYLIDGTETATAITDTSGTDTLKLVATAGAFAGSSTVSLVGIADVENFDASAITTGNLTLSGNDLDNTITGGAGNNTIDGGAGNDTIFGGIGNDNISGGSGNAALVGDDYVFIDYYNNVRHTGTALSAPNLGGGPADPGDPGVVTANPAMAYGCNDLLVGGDGNDTYLFNGDEEYWVDSWATVVKTSVTETVEGGIDTIKLTAAEDGSYGQSLTNNTEVRLEAISTNANTIENIDASAITNNNYILTLEGNALNNVIIGSETNDIILGGAGNDTIFGGAGNDTITGGAGIDTIDGGLGDDTYVIEDTNDIITDTSGNNKIQLTSSFSESGLDLNSIYTNANISEVNASAVATGLTLIGNATTATTITGGSGDDTITGGSQADLLQGGLGNDTYILKDTSDSVVDVSGNNKIKLDAAYSLNSLDLTSIYTNAHISQIDASAVATGLTLVGNATTATTITGGSGDDTITGGSQADLLQGGLGNDTYVIKDTGDSIVDVSGNNKIKLDAAYSLSSLDLTSVYTNAHISQIDASAVATGLTLVGNATTATTITGGSGNDSIFGGTSNDTLYGGAGTNVLNGGAGNDTYLIDGIATATTITDTSGTDTITLFNSLSGDGTGVFAGGASYSIAGSASIENLNASLITSNMTLTGNGANNIISGGSGDDTITGGAGSNTLLGGAGNDTYIIDGSETSTTITDTSGIDTIKLIDNPNDPNPPVGPGEVTDYFSLAGHTDIENLDVTGITNDDTNLTGNNLDNIIYGTNYTSNYIDGGAGNDYIRGGAGNDALIGGLGNDTLIGGKGNDTLNGGTGANTYQFNEGDQKDLITSTNSTDTININDTTGITKADMLFYTDAAGNFFIDYTDVTVGSDIAKITAGNYDANTTIKIGNDTIHINSILSQLAGTSTSGLSAAAISALNTTTEATQVAALTSAWISS